MVPEIVCGIYRLSPDTYYQIGVISGEDPIILLDDPLSAVDSRCAKHIFNKLIKEELSDKTRILVTHATNFLSEVDRIVVMDTKIVGEKNDRQVHGAITHVGTFSELTEKGQSSFSKS